MSKILAFVGKKGSGKNTLCNFLHGYQLKAYEKIEGFDIDQDGCLIIQQGEGFVKLDVTRNDLQFAEWASYEVWPFVQQYAFATPLKDMCENLFNIPRECLHGTDEQKNQVQEHLQWEAMPVPLPRIDSEACEKLKETLKQSQDGVIDLVPGKMEVLKPKTGSMTAREFMQYFGSEVMRNIYPNIWSDFCIKSIKKQESALSIITDCRFENEIKAVQEAGGKCIYLTRTIDESDSHVSENSADIELCDAVIQNHNMDILQSCQETIKILESWKWM